MKKIVATILVFATALTFVLTGCAATPAASSQPASSAPAATAAPVSSAPASSAAPAASASAPASAAASATPVAHMVDGAKLVVYSGLSEADMTALSAAYKKDTGNDMSYVVGNIGDLTARVEAEKANPQADILLGGSVDVYDPLGKKGDFLAYSSSANKDLDSRFNDPNGFWQGWYMGVLCILYNPDRFNKLIAPKGVSVPQTWDDLLNPAYKGEFLMGDPATAGGSRVFVADQIFRLGETQAWDYMKKLDANVAQYTAGATTNIPLIGKGEFTIGMSWAHDTYKAKASGQPINIVIPADTAYEIGGSAIIKDAPNTDNAKAFIDWLLSKPTQELNTATSKRYPVRTDVASPDGLPALADVKLVNYDRAKAGSMQDAIKSTFASQIMANRPK